MKKARFLAGKLLLLNSSVEGLFLLFLNRISLKSAGFALIILSFFVISTFFPVFGKASSKVVEENFVLTSPNVNKTKSLFQEKIVSLSKTLAFSKKTVVDRSLKPGESKIVQEGIAGTRMIQTKVTLHSGKEFSRQIISIVEKAPQAEVVAVGPVINSVSTDIGSLNYKAKLTMWATAYDAHCSGCNGLTATGQKTGYGVVAVDPNIIPLGTKLYIPGYGQAVAGDTGGSIKGNKIDLGFDNVALSGWYSHFVEVYIL